MLDRLEQLGHLSDRRFAETFVRARMARWGRGRLARELRERGVDATLAATVLDAVIDTGEGERAHAVVCRKAATPPAPGSAADAKLRRFLASRGFDGDAVRDAFARWRAGSGGEAEGADWSG